MPLGKNETAGTNLTWPYAEIQAFFHAVLLPRRPAGTQPEPCPSLIQGKYARMTAEKARQMTSHL